MKGRLQAALLALLGIPLLSTAAVGLVTLRLGHQQGLLIAVAALVPTLIGVMMDRMPELLFWLSLISVFSVFAYAILLRAFVSWEFTLLAASALIAVLVPLFTWQSDSLIESFSRVLVSPQQLAEGSSEVSVVLQSHALVSGIIALVIMLNGFTSLVLSRWWQSLLYNPGGFGEEFRALRLSLAPTIVLLVLSGFCYIAGANYSLWMILFMSPLAIAALALAHFVAKAKGLGGSWLASLYLLTVFFLVPMLMILTIIGALDAVFNFRKRFE